MGIGREVCCPYCGYKEDFYLEHGFDFLDHYKHVFKKAIRGDYGKEWQEQIISNPMAIIDSGISLYRCESCNHLSAEENLTIYESQHKTNDDLGNLMLILHDPHKDVKILKEYSHKCPVCAKRMKEILFSNGLEDLNTDKTIICPQCSRDADVYRLYWD